MRRTCKEIVRQNGQKNYLTLSFMSAHFSNNLSLCYKCSFCFWLAPVPSMYTISPQECPSRRLSLARLFSFFLLTLFWLQFYNKGCGTREKRLFLWCFLSNVTTASTNGDSHAIHPYHKSSAHTSFVSLISPAPSWCLSSSCSFNQWSWPVVSQP